MYGVCSMLRVAQCSMHFFVVAAAAENSLIEHEVQRPDRLRYGILHCVFVIYFE